jgi:DNA-binding GntR family transcriptional regulator
MPPYQQLLKKHESEGTLSDAVYAVLRQCIVEGRLPPGSRLQPEDLSQQMNVSRTPVRDALRRLEAEEFLAPQSRKGLIVKELSAKDLTEIFQIREELESLAARLATQNITEIELVSLERLIKEMESTSEADAKWLRELTGEFHLQVARASHNTRLYQMIKELQDRIHLFEGSTLFLPGRTRKAIEEHRSLVKAIKDRDAAMAEEVVRRHRRRTLEIRLTTPLPRSV